MDEQESCHYTTFWTQVERDSLDSRPPHIAAFTMPEQRIPLLTHAQPQTSILTQSCMDGSVRLNLLYIFTLAAREPGEAGICVLFENGGLI